MAQLVLRPLINKSVDIIGQGASLLYWLESDIRWLQENLELMEAYLSVAHAKQDKDTRVATLIKQIDDLAVDVDDLLDTYLPAIKPHDREGHSVRLKNVGRFIGSAPNALIFALEIEKIKTRVQQIEEKRNAYGITETNGHHEGNIYGSLFLHADEPNIFIGRSKDERKLKLKLRNQRVKYRVISIVGMAGLGKTTLAKRIYNCVKDGFGCFACVYVSRVPNVKELLLSIARQVGVKEKQLKEDSLQVEELQLELLSVLKVKTYLILLDDIWEPAAWDQLKCLFPSNPKDGSRLIITSRNNDVGRYIGGPSSLHELKSLNSVYSLKLLRKLTHEGNTTNFGDLEGTGTKIANKCHGVPLAIELIAGVLRSRERNERQWSCVLESMDHYKQDYLDVSYKDLPNELKACFLYLGLFPEGYEIPASRLINMWMAEKFIRAHGTHEFEKVGEDHLYNLAARNMVQVVKREIDGRIKSCRLHSLLHRFCINVAEKNNFFYTLDTLEKSDPKSVMKVRRLTTHLRSIDDYIALNPQMPKLRALLCFSKFNRLNKEHKRMIFGEHKLLRVLRVDFGLGFVPKRIRSMRQLSYLETSWLSAHSSRFKKLKNLQSIYFDGFIYGSFDHMWKIEKLRHLAVRCYHFLSLATEMPLPNLQTLDIRFLPYDPQELAIVNIVNIVNRLPSLRRLRLSLDEGGPIIEALSGTTKPTIPKIESLSLASWSSRSRPLRINLSNYLNLGYLRLNVPLNKLPNANEFPPNLIRLNLQRSELTEDPMETLGRLPKLKILQFCFNSYLGESMHCSGVDSFPHLKVLELSELSLLKEVIVDGGVLPQLKTLAIRDCARSLRIPKRFRDITKRIHKGGTDEI